MDQSVAFLKTATVHTMNVDDVVFGGVNVSQTGGYGVWFDEGSYNCAFMNGMVSELGAGGVRFGANAGLWTYSPINCQDFWATIYYEHLNDSILFKSSQINTKYPNHDIINRSSIEIRDISK